MPSFDLESTRAFWSHYMDGAVIDIIKYMELKESAMNSDDPQVQSSLQALGDALDDASTLGGASTLDLIKIAAGLHMSQKLRFMQFLDSINPGQATQMISMAEIQADNEPLAKKFLERNKKFECIRILRKVYHPDRLQTLMSLYE